jgi:MYXO-CTERM domain-containing protein
MKSLVPIFRIAAFCGVTLTGVSAFAHVELQSPTPRARGQSEGNLKNTPCGQTADGRTDRVTVFEPGQTITVTFNEFIDHPAYYRVAFDPDGDTFPMRTGVPANAVESAAAAQAAEEALFQGTGSTLLAVVPEVNGKASSATVTLPDVECEACTLQLIEFMYDKADPQHGYYQCADIALRSAGGTGTPPDGEGTGEAGSGGEDTSEDESSGTAATGADAGPLPNVPGIPGTDTPATSAAPGNGSSTPAAADTPSNGAVGSGPSSSAPSAPTASSSGTAGTAATLPPLANDDGDSDGGCSFTLHNVALASHEKGSLVLAGLGLLTAMRRRKSAR